MRWMLALEHLHGLLIHAHHHRIFRRIEVQPAYSLGLLQKLRVGAFEPLPDTMRSQVLETQNPTHFVHADPMTRAVFQSVGEGTIRPDVSKRCWLLLPSRPMACELHQLAPDLQRDPCRPPRPLHVLQGANTRVLCKPCLPLPHGSRPDAQFSGNLHAAQPIPGHQNNLTSHHHRMRSTLSSYQKLGKGEAM